MLDLGANTECDAQNLVQFAVMGAAYARTVLGIAKPRVKLLNIGTEELKGTDELKDAAALAARGRLSAVPLRRLHRGRPAVARRRRRRRHRRLFRQYRAQDRRGHRALRHRPAAPRLQELAPLEGRLRAVAAGAQPAQGPPRPQQPQWRGLPRPQRPGREEPRQRQRPRASPTPSASPRAWSATTSPARSARTSTISAPTPSPTRPRNDPPLGRRRRRQRAAQAPGHQRRAGRDRSTPPTNGSSSAPESAAAISPATARPPRRLATDAARARARACRHRRDATSTSSSSPPRLPTRPSRRRRPRSRRRSASTIASPSTSTPCAPASSMRCRSPIRCFASGNAEQGAGDRRGDLQPDPRLGRPRRPASCSATAPARWCSSAEDSDGGILATKLHADGRHNDLLFVDGGPSTTGTVGKLRMKGREVFRHAVVNLADVLNEVLADAGLTSADVDWVVPHQANARILDATAKKLGLPPEKVVVTVDRACQHVGGVGSAGVRHGGQGRPNQARRHRRAGSDGRWLYMGRGSAQVLKKLEYPTNVELPTASNSVTKV